MPEWLAALALLLSVVNPPLPPVHLYIWGRPRQGAGLRELCQTAFMHAS